VDENGTTVTKKQNIGRYLKNERMLIIKKYFDHLYTHDYVEESPDILQTDITNV
jgi:hypothetical protein